MKKGTDRWGVGEGLGGSFWAGELGGASIFVVGYPKHKNGARNLSLWVSTKI